MIAFLAMAGCKKDDIKIMTTPLGDVLTLQATNVHNDDATLQGQIKINFSGVQATGFIFSDAPIAEGTESNYDPVNTDSYDEKGIFRHYIDGLTNMVNGERTGKLYYYKACMRKSNGEMIYGQQIIFTTDVVNTIPPPAPLMSRAPKISGRSVDLGVSSGGMGSIDNPTSLVINLQVAEIGYYIWKESDSLNTVRRMAPLSETEARLLGFSECVMTINELLPKTTYACSPFIIVGAYKDSHYWNVYSQEKTGSVTTFTTLEVFPPTVITADSILSTATTAIFGGKVTDFGNDDLPLCALRYGTSPSNLSEYIFVDNIDEEGNFSLTAKRLTPATKYYYQAYVKNFAGDNPGEIKTLWTDEKSKPIVENLTMDYNYRRENTTGSTAKIKCELFSDGGETLTDYGVMIGTDPANLVKKPYTEAYNEDTGEFCVEVTALSPGTTYYYIVYAENARGGSEGDMLTFCTPVYGGKQLWFNSSSGVASDYSFQKMTPVGPDLYYWELDPVVSGNYTYHLLDRNLGATEIFTLENCSEALTTSTNSLYNATGYYFQWGLSAPSFSPFIVDGEGVALAGIENSFTQMAWVDNANNANQDVIKTSAALADWPDDGTWSNLDKYRPYLGNPCPEGYHLPTAAEMTAILDLCPDKTISGIHSRFQMGTSYARQQGGNHNTTFSGLWCKDSGTTGVNANCFDDSGTSGTFVSGSRRSRVWAMPVRCIRVETHTP